MMLIDQCKHCVFRGHIKKCQAAECSQHESWYAKTLSYKVEQREKENESAKKAFKEIYNSQQGLIAKSPYMIAESYLRLFSDWFSHKEDNEK